MMRRSGGWGNEEIRAQGSLINLMFVLHYLGIVKEDIGGYKGWNTVRYVNDNFKVRR